MKIIDMVMKLLTDRMPRKTALASIVMTFTLIIFAGLFFTLGTSHDDAFDRNVALKKDLGQTTSTVKKLKDDRKFILDNQEKYEELLHGDRLVPHTRRVAVTQLTNLALQRGLTTVNFNFTAAGERAASAAASQPVTGGYKVKVEKIELKVGSALDTQLYDFIQDLGESFPGSAVVEQFTLERAPEITTEALNQVSRGHESGLVHGDVQLTWRIAEAEEQDKKNAPAAPKGAR
jgi:hypothetical protein